MIVCVEGNVGAGKTNLLATLERYGYTVVRQPAALWRRLAASRDTPFVQCAVLVWYLLVARRLKMTPQVVFVERSPMSAHLVFTAGCVFDAATKRCYERLRELAETQFRPDAYFFVDTPPTDCYATLAACGRHCDRALLHLYCERYWQMARALANKGVWVVV